ncbi:uncharacterized protein LOC133185042 [Saccostrea echinata]|uniref:uncharacterized protein LOC133185042 n=1 Tax=Saccostrea echinata TaxID=191078 RepID=UPI002A81004E|nr:uncharacterized protein LOC133185042 [Saccostrea echinata]
MVSALGLSFICLSIYNGVLRITGMRSCSETSLHVTSMCSPDSYLSSFIYLDVHNASLYYLQSCSCTVHVRFPGKIYFVPERTPSSDCGSAIHIVSYDGNQNYTFLCTGSTSFHVKKDDKINITVRRTNLEGPVYNTSYCYIISLASDSGIGSEAFQISCPFLERRTTTSTTTTTLSTTSSSTPSVSTAPVSTQEETTSLPNSTTSPKLITDTSKDVSENDRVSEKDRVYLEVVIPLGIVVPMALISLAVVFVFIWRRNILQRLFKNSKNDSSSNQHDVVIDEGDGLKENISQHNTDDMTKDGNSSSPIVDIKLTNATPTASRVKLRKSASNKNIIVITPDSKGKESANNEATVRPNRRSVLDWRKSETDDSYFTEIHLGSGSKTVITVDNLPHVQNDEHIRYDDIRTEL